MRMIVRKKKKECWKRFYEENSEKDLWKVMKWTNNLWRIREVMKAKRNIDNVPLNTNEKRVEGLIRDHFMWNEKVSSVDEEIGEANEEEAEGRDVDEMVKKVKVAIGRTQNISAPEPDGISYRFIKIIKDSILWEKVLEEVAINLVRGQS